MSTWIFCGKSLGLLTNVWLHLFLVVVLVGFVGWESSVTHRVTKTSSFIVRSSEVGTVRQFLGGFLQDIDSFRHLGPVECWKLAASFRDFRVSRFSDGFSGEQCRGLLFDPNRGIVLLTLNSWVDADGAVSVQVVDERGNARIYPLDLVIESGFSEICQPTNLGRTRCLGSCQYRVAGEIQGLGLVAPNSDNFRDFSVENHGDSNLYVESIQASCGCVSVEPNQKLTIAPSCKTDFRAVVKSGTKGDFRQSVRVTLGDGYGATEDLSIVLVGNCIPSMSISPEILDFGYLSSSDSKTQSRRIVLTETLNDRFRIRSVNCSDLHLTGSVVSSEMRDGVLVHSVELKMCPQSFSAGIHNEWIEVETDSQIRPRVKVPVKFVIEPGLVRIIPSHLIIPRSQQFSASLLVRAITGTELAVDVTDVPKHAEATVEKLGPLTSRVRLTFTPDQTLAEQGKLVISTTVGTEVEVHSIAIERE